jgi:general stress protein 26
LAIMTATAEQIEIVTKLVEDARVAMVTTVAEDGKLVSRPLALTERVFDGDLFFFTQDPSPKTDQIRANQAMNVALQSGNDYVSLSGTATVSKDRTMIEGLWNRHAEAWFENGIDDPTVALLQFRADTAEYWSIDTPRVVAAIKYAAAMVTGSKPDLGENEVVDLDTTDLRDRA